MNNFMALSSPNFHTRQVRANMKVKNQQTAHTPWNEFRKQNWRAKSRKSLHFFPFHKHLFCSWICCHFFSHYFFLNGEFLFSLLVRTQDSALRTHNSAAVSLWTPNAQLKFEERSSMREDKRLMKTKESMKMIFSEQASSVCLPPELPYPNGMDLPTSFLPPNNQQWTRFGIFEPVSLCIDQVSHHNIQANCLLTT